MTKGSKHQKGCYVWMNPKGGVQEFFGGLEDVKCHRCSASLSQDEHYGNQGAHITIAQVSKA